MPELLECVLPYMFQAWNRLCEEIQDWPYRNTGNPSLPCVLQVCPSVLLAKATLEELILVSGNQVTSTRDAGGNLKETPDGWTYGAREGGGIGLSIVMFCVRQNFCCLCLMCLV